MRDEGAPGPLTQASAPQAPGRLAREDARTSGGGTLEMAATGVAEHVQRRSGAYWRDLVFSRLLPSLFFSLFLARQLILLAGGVHGIHQPSDALFLAQQLLALAYFTMLVVLYAVRLPQRGTDHRLAVILIAAARAWSSSATSSPRRDLPTRSGAWRTCGGRFRSSPRPGGWSQAVRTR